MQQRQTLKVEKRTVVGKKTDTLRAQDLLPANVYGKGIESMAVQVVLKDFEKVYKEVGKSGLIDIDVAGQKRPVLIHNVQLGHLNQEPLHADFYQVNLKEKIKTMVPVELVGEAKAVTDKLGLVLQTLSEIEVEALPENLPEKIEVNIEKLAEVDDQITVSELAKIANVEIITGEDQVLVKISELVSEEAKADAVAEATAATEAAVPAEGEAAPAGDEKTAESAAESKEDK